MKLSRALVTVILAFLCGGSAAELFLKTKTAIERSASQEGSAGELVSLEFRDGEGNVIARPRLVSTPGRPVELVIRSPEDPARIRLGLRIETERMPSGDLLVGYRIALPALDLETRGHVSVTPGVEQVLALGEYPVVATIFTIPVPSAAFDAYLDYEKARNAITRM